MIQLGKFSRPQYHSPSVHQKRTKSKARSAGKRSARKKLNRNHSSRIAQRKLRQMRRSRKPTQLGRGGGVCLKEGCRVLKSNEFVSDSNEQSESAKTLYICIASSLSVLSPTCTRKVWNNGILSQKNSFFWPKATYIGRNG